MSEWFRAVPISLDNIAQAAKAGFDDPTDMMFTQRLYSFNKKHWRHRFAIIGPNFNSSAL